MLNLKELLIKKVKNYKIGDIDSKDADRLRKGMIAFIKNNSVEKIDEALDIYINKLYELCEINDLTFFIEDILETIEEETDE